MVAVEFKGVVRGQNGSVTIQFGDSEYEFSSMSDLKNWLSDVETPQVAHRLCLGYALARSSDLSNVATVRNKTFSLDLSAPSPIKVQ